MLCSWTGNRAHVLAEPRTGITACSKGSRTEPRNEGSWLSQVQGIFASTVEQKRAFQNASDGTRKPLKQNAGENRRSGVKLPNKRSTRVSSRSTKKHWSANGILGAMSLGGCLESKSVHTKHLLVAPSSYLPLTSRHHAPASWIGAVAIVKTGTAQVRRAGKPAGN